MKSPIYHSIETYRFTMKKLYGKQFESRYSNLAEHVPAGKTITELCPGDGYLFENYLKNTNPDYSAVEWNRKFSLYLREMGVKVITQDLTKTKIPSAQVILMQGSLYQFEDHTSMVEDIFEAAKELVVISEPIDNIVNSKNKIISGIGAHLSNPGDGPKHFRFTKGSLLETFEGYPEPQIHHYPAAKEVILVFQK